MSIHEWGTTHNSGIVLVGHLCARVEEKSIAEIVILVVAPGVFLKTGCRCQTQNVYSLFWFVRPRKDDTSTTHQECNHRDTRVDKTGYLHNAFWCRGSNAQVQLLRAAQCNRRRNPWMFWRSWTLARLDRPRLASQQGLCSNFETGLVGRFTKHVYTIFLLMVNYSRGSHKCFRTN